MQEPESETPGIAITLYAVGAISLVAGVISFVAATQDGSPAVQSDIIGAVGGIIGGFVFIAMGYGLKKLCQIEAHLRFRKNADGAKARVAVETALTSTTKKCPDCAEVVQVEARTCRFCGLVFPVPTASEAEPVHVVAEYAATVTPGQLAPVNPGNPPPQLDEEAWRKWKDRKK